MFAGSGDKKNESVVSKAQAARQQRAEERAKEKAVLKIQVSKMSIFSCNIASELR